jgi:hypothetical protein
MSACRSAAASSEAETLLVAGGLVGTDADKIYFSCGARCNDMPQGSCPHENGSINEAVME